MMFDEDGTIKFDGLIVCVSCHGVKDSIITSDIKTIAKTVIHRTLSLKYPKLREIPRIFLFDCCSGSDIRRPTIEMDDEPSQEIEMTVAKSPTNMDGPLVKEDQFRKGTDLDDLQNVNSWTSSTKNPDYNMVAVHAANSGFAAQMSDYKGSYLVYSLVKAIKLNIEKRTRKTLAELLEDVQNLLHDLGRQQTVNIFNNHTRTLVFKKNTQK